MRLEDCLITGAETVDSNTLNRCLYNLYRFTCDQTTNTIEHTTENFPNHPFYLDGYFNALTEHPEISKYNLTPASTGKAGVVPRLYNGSPSVAAMDDRFIKTETPTGGYRYTESEIATFAPTVQSMFNDIRPCIFSSLLGDDTSTMSTGTSSVGAPSNPIVKFTSYIVCGYTGVSFGTITFNQSNGDKQNNVIALNISRDLINMDNVEKIKFFSVSNGVNSGIRGISENKDVVSDITSCNVTYISDMDVVISNITKNDNSPTIRIDNKTGRILGDDEVVDRDEYTELLNDEYSLNFFIVYELSQNVHTFDESTWCFYVTRDAEYAKTKLYDADSYARNNLKYKFLGFEAADDGYEDEYSDTHSFTTNGSHVCHNATTTAKDAFNGCFNAIFPLLSYFSTELRYTDRMFKDCHHATFDLLPEEIKLDKLKTATSMFENCTTAGFSRLKSLNLPASTQLKSMFAGCSNANFTVLSSLDINGNCSKMFLRDYYATFENLIYIVGNIPVINSMFEGCHNATFERLNKIESTSTNIILADRMFYNLELPTFEALTILSLGTNGYNAVSMFEGCSSATFRNLQTIGNPINATAMFKDCSAENATFENLNSFGSLITNGTSMFEGCTHLNMTIDDNVDSLVTASNMFKDVNSIVVNGNMNFVVNANGMFSDDNSAIIRGNMNSVTNGRGMFTYTTDAYMYGTMNNLVDADMMFDNTVNAYMQEISNTVTNMSNMFSNTESCCVTNYKGSDNLRYCSSAFENSQNVAVTGNIFAGRPYTMINMFANAGKVELCNPTMNGNPEDVEHRYFSTTTTVDVAMVNPIDGELDNSKSVLIGGKYNSDDSIVDSVVLVLNIKPTETNYTIHSILDGNAFEKTINKDDYTYSYDGNSCVGESGIEYVINEINGEDGNYTDNDNIFVYRYNNFGTLERMNTYFTISNNDTLALGDEFTVIAKQSNSDGELSRVTMKFANAANKKLLFITDTSSTTINLPIDSNITELNVSTKLCEYTVENTVYIGMVIYFKYDNVVNSLIFYPTNHGNIYTEVINNINVFEPPTLIVSSSDSAKIYQLFDNPEETDYYAYFVATQKTDNSKSNFFLYSGRFNGIIPDTANNQGDIYSIQMIFDGSETTLNNPPPVVELGLDSKNDMSDSLRFTNNMFYNVISTSCLSGYDDVIPISLQESAGMFKLDNKPESDDTFEHVGNIFKNMDRSSIWYADEMFKNRIFVNPYPFANANQYSFRIPLKLQSANGMFENTEINIDNNTEIGFVLPSTLLNANSAFKNYSGGLIRFAYNTVGEIFIRDELECDDMFYNCHFANTTKNKYSVSIGSMHIPMFHNSDFAFSDINHITDRSGIYFKYNAGDYGNAEFILTDKFITEYATLNSIIDDISTWFDEGIYLASILCPPDNKYRLQTNVGEVISVNANNIDTLIDVLAYTNNVTLNSVHQLNGRHAAFMFNPSIALALTDYNDDGEYKLANRIDEFATPLTDDSKFEYISAKLQEDEKFNNYQALTLKNIEQIGNVESPFAYASLKNVTFDKLKTINSNAVNTVGMFFDSKNATFSQLENINIAQYSTLSTSESDTTFKSAYLDVVDKPEYIGNYNDMFRGCVRARFNNLETINIRSTYFKLLPSDKDNMLFVYTTEDENGKHLNYNVTIAVTDEDGNERYITTSVRMVLTIRDGQYVVELHNNDDNDKIFRYTDLQGDVQECILRTGIVGSFVPEITYEFAELNRSYDDVEQDYEFTVILTIKDSNPQNLIDATSYYTITFNNYHELVFNKHAKYPLFEDAYGKIHNTIPFIDDNSTQYFNTPNYHYGITLSNDADSNRYSFKVCYFNETPIVGFNTRIPSNATIDVILREDVIDEQDYLVISIPSTGRYAGTNYLYHVEPTGDGLTGDGVITEDPSYTPHTETAVSNAYTIRLTPRVAPQSRNFGITNKYTLDFVQSENNTYEFHIMERYDDDIVTFITDIDTSVKLDFIDVYEETRDGEVVFITNFYGSGISYVIHKNGEVEEEIMFPVPIKYKLHLTIENLDTFGIDSTTYCSNMFRDCENATFENLRIISLGTRGSCSGMFKGCSNAILKNINVMYLPVADTDNNGTYSSNWYAGIFEGLVPENIDLSKLHESTTNIHLLGNNTVDDSDTSKTDGSVLFANLFSAGELATRNNVQARLKLPATICDKMVWSSI